MMKKIAATLLLVICFALSACSVKSEIAPIRVQSITLNKLNTAILVGATETLAAVVAPIEADNKAVVWSATNPKVATVSDKGVVTALAAGTTTISVTTKDGNHTATCVVSVSQTAVAVTGVSLNRHTVEIKEGGTLNLIDTIVPANATNQNVDWTTNDPTIATVSETGVVTAVAEGVATITVTTKDGNHTATCQVLVSKTVVATTGITLAQGTVSVDLEMTTILVATVAPQNATNKQIDWTTSDPSVVSVSSAGSVSGVAEGIATITATTQDGGHTATCTVIVNPSRPINRPTAADYVEVGDLCWAKGNLVAVASKINECKVGTAEDYGLYFQFGSLIGYTGGLTGNGEGAGEPALDKAVWPIAMGTAKPSHAWGHKEDQDINTLTLHYFNYSLSPWMGESNNIGTFLEMIAGQSNTYGTLSNGRYAGLGVGDPCTYYLGVPWRTPSGAEWITLLGPAGEQTNLGVPLQVTSYPDLSLPPSSLRDNYTGEFNPSYVDKTGFLSTTTPQGARSSWHPSFMSGVLSHTDTRERSYGFAVRCVSNKSVN